MTTHQTQSGIRNPVAEDRGLLRRLLRLDAAASGALGALSLVASPALDDLLRTLRVPWTGDGMPGFTRLGREAARTVHLLR